MTQINTQKQTMLNMLDYIKIGLLPSTDKYGSAFLRLILSHSNYKITMFIIYKI